VEGLFLQGGECKTANSPASVASTLKIKGFTTRRCLSCASIVYQSALYIAQGARKVLRAQGLSVEHLEV
jgi:hypothetical protein